MVSVVFKKTNDVFTSFTMSGHAQFDDIGSDIVCAGISTIAFGALNGLNEMAPGNFDLKVEHNLIEAQALNDVCINNKLLMFTYYQLKTVEQQYPQNINIKVMEV